MASEFNLIESNAELTIDDISFLKIRINPIRITNIFTSSSAWQMFYCVSYNTHCIL